MFERLPLFASYDLLGMPFFGDGIDNSLFILYFGVWAMVAFVQAVRRLYVWFLRYRYAGRNSRRLRDQHSAIGQGFRPCARSGRHLSVRSRRRTEEDEILNTLLLTVQRRFPKWAVQQRFNSWTLFSMPFLFEFACILRLVWPPSRRWATSISFGCVQLPAQTWVEYAGRVFDSRAEAEAELAWISAKDRTSRQELVARGWHVQPERGLPMAASQEISSFVIGGLR